MAEYIDVSAMSQAIAQKAAAPNESANNEKDEGQEYANKTLEARAIQIVRDERIRWENATAFVTDRVSFKMRNLIRILRKNYYGVFDEPNDPHTGLQKVWYPLTEINVEAVVKNIDLDQKDINFRSKTANGYAMTEVTRAAVKDKLSNIYFGQKLDNFERYLAIDGTAVWKTWEENKKMRVELVDLLNIYIDPTTPSIQEAYRFTERSLMFTEDMQAMKSWINTADIIPVEGLPRVDPYYGNRSTMMNSNVKMVDVWECWGKIPKSLITGKKSDDGIEIDGRLVVSGLDSPGKERCHLIEENTKKDAEGNAMKPYEEAWFTRVPNRWYGRGVAEKLMTLQIYSNIVFNVRINRSRISQLGLFKIRKGSGITPQMLSRLPSNGAVVLNSLDDLQQFEIQEAGLTSYKDEEVVNTLSQRLTNAFDVVTGESMPSSTPATNAVIQNQNAKTGFSLIKDGIGFFLERWMDRHALPIIAKELTIDQIVRFAQDDETFKALVDRVVMYQAAQSLDDAFAQGYVPTDDEMMVEIEAARDRISKTDLFLKNTQDVIAQQLETKVYVTNEEMDIAVTVQNLINMMSVAPEYREAMVKQAFDLMGLGTPKTPRQMQPQLPSPFGQPGMQPGGAPGMPGTPGAGAPGLTPQLGGQQMQQQSTSANTAMALPQQ